MEILVRENKMLKNKMPVAVATNILVIPTQHTGLNLLYLTKNVCGWQ